MFFEAQKRFNEGTFFGERKSHNYVRDLLTQYGDGGRRMHLPTVADDDVQRAMQFRADEKSRYKEMADTVARLQAENQQLRKKRSEYVKFITSLKFLDPEKSDVAGDRGRGGGDDSGGDSGGVLPAVQDDTSTREVVSTISSAADKNESPADRASVGGGDDGVVVDVTSVGSEEDREGSGDTGRSSSTQAV